MSPSPPPSLTSSSSLPPMLVEFYEDDLLNELYAPPVASPEPPPVAPSHMRDSYLYNMKEQAAYDRQLALEEETLNNAVDRFRKRTEQASNRGDVVTHRNAHDLLLGWYNPFILALRMMIENNTQSANISVGETLETSISSSSTLKRPRRTGRRKCEGDEEIHKILVKTSPEIIAVIVIHTLLGSLMREVNGLPLTRAAHTVAEAIHAEVNMKKVMELHRKHEKEVKKQAAISVDGSTSPIVSSRTVNKAVKESSSLVTAVKLAAARAEEKEANWTGREQMLLGTKLIDLFMSVAKVKDEHGQFVPAITHGIRFRKSDKSKVGVLQFSEAAINVLKEEDPCLAEYVSPKQQPMVVRPRPWTSPSDGAYLRCQAYLVRRIPGSHEDVEKVLQNADLSTIYEGLNALGGQEWCVNRNVLDPAQTLWDQGGGVAGLVTKTNCDVPERKEFLAAEFVAFEKRRAERELWVTEDAEEEVGMIDYEFDEKKALRKLKSERQKAQKLNRELVSMRADTEHRMRQARRFAGEERIWLPHNIDFRGRAYPVPVHLQHMGCDLTRALLTFAKPGVELGERGLFWLKIHMANLLGGDKLSFNERIDVAEDNMEQAIRVGRDPLSDSHLDWWSSVENPFQLLSTCCEIAQAGGRFGGERAMKMYESSLPISIDGSCNGLQHYAALGRDIEGGTQVNLVPYDRPQDVYSGIAKLVSEKIDELASRGDEICGLLKGKVSRKVVKQTVMTSVYGVTPVGARQQIMNRLAEIEGIPEDKMFPAAMKLALMTLTSLGDIFQGATDTMGWLYESAQKISRAGHKVEWTTPVGLPVIQPYRRTERKVVRTLLQRVTLQRSGDHCPVSTSRQRSAFPPNFVHSIDSAHMLMTAIRCHKQGLNFAAVHDSFWTNAAHVDLMNKTLREEFIRLHERDLLRELRESFLMRYVGVKFSKLPPRGLLDLSVVRDSQYFFS